MKFCSFLILIFLPANIYAQNKFEIIQTKETIEDILKIEKRYKKNKVLFNDKDFIVTSSCSGEWGGTVKFTEKSSQIIYSAEATCPISVDKFGENYYVTSSLAHMSGFTEIIKIGNPKEMEVYKISPPKKIKGKYTKYTEEDESQSKKGTEQLLDSIGEFTLAAFLYENEFYYIVTNFEDTYLSRIKGKKFIEISKLPVNDIWSYDPKIIKFSNNHIILLFDDEKEKGYIEVVGNKINIVTTE